MTELFAAGCQGSDTSNTGQSIKIEREVVLEGVRGQPNAIARMPDGRLVVAGKTGTGLAVATSEDGKVLWKFEEPEDKAIETPYQSEYSGVVPLANGKLLLCGRMSTRDSFAGIGLITILNGNGQLVERRLLRPNDDRRFTIARLNSCLPWDDGIVVFGGATDGEHGTGWLLKLDKNGAKQWERVESDLGGAVSETHDHGFLLATPGSGGDTTFTKLVRVNQQGEIVARRTINSTTAVGVLRSIGPPRKDEVIVYTPNAATLYTLDDQLGDLEPPRSIPRVLINIGRGYVRPDGSLALLGNFYRGGPYVAAIGWIDVSGRLVADLILEPHPDSVTVRDAMPLSPTEFVAARAKASLGETVVLTWVSFR